MDKAHSTPTVTVRDPRTGQFVTVLGVGSLKNSTFAIRKSVDLTKPIAKQVSKRSGGKPAKTSKG